RSCAVSEDLRYPVGRYIPPAAWDPAAMAAGRRDIHELPARMRAAVSGLNDAQLDTPYRDGGWTVRQVVHHVVDSHLNAYCRFKLGITEEHPTIKPYMEALWAELPDSRLPITPSLDMQDGLHLRWVALLDSMTPEQFNRTVFHPEHNRSMTLWWLLG